MISLLDYGKINSSYKRTLVFHFGAFAGFYSEYNNMLKAMAFCLVHKIRFKMYSKDAKFSQLHGWTDYFDPFVDEVEEDFHRVLNVRFPDDPKRTAFFMTFLKRKIKKILGKKTAEVSYSFYDSCIRHRMLKWKYGFSFFTYDLWNDIVHINLDDIVNVDYFFCGTYFMLIKELDEMVWRYNYETKIAVDDKVLTLLLPKEYVGMHIRGGDKIIEAKLLNWTNYVKRAIAVMPNCDKWFVFTDDYSIVEAIKNEYPDHIVYSLCDSNERGYYYEQFLADKGKMFDKMIRMFAAVDICKKADCFIGTRTANPYFVISLYKNGENCISLD